MCDGHKRIFSWLRHSWINCNSNSFNPNKTLLSRPIKTTNGKRRPQKGAGEMNKVKWISNTLKKDKDDIYRPVQSMIEPTKPKDALQYAMMNLERKKDKKNDRT